VGLDGVEKMSKSLGNFIGVTESPDQIFGKTMSVSDDLMWTYYTLLTDLSVQEIEEMKGAVSGGRLHPMAAKVQLAGRLVADFHSKEAADEAKAEFERRFSKAEGPVQADSVPAPCPLPDGTASLLVALGLAPSKNVARQKVKEGAVAVSDDGIVWTKVENPAEPFTFASDGTRFVKVGKRFLRVVENQGGAS
jgi:tyrosyl-tRNA synthetase